MNEKTAFDVIVIGAGPAGLGFARALADTNLRICLLERQARATLSAPALDGRDIALTHDTMRLMRDLGMWQHIRADEISPIREARVLSGASAYFLGFDTHGTGKEELGVLVPNSEIRRAAWLVAQPYKNITIRDGVEVKNVSTDATCGRVTLAGGEVLSAPLVVAADSRFSASRAQMGVPVDMKDFGRSAIVCRMTHKRAHHEIAHECFLSGWTVAVLPLQGQKSSIVITLPNGERDAVMKASPEEFNRIVSARVGDKVGDLTLIGERHAYPLVATYAAEFASRRFALMGDAAVGMHPVTAHGYNLGLHGAYVLAQEIRKALRRGLDIGDPSVLRAYARQHRRKSAFLYYGTNAVVGVYTDDRPLALAARAIGLHLGNLLPPFKKYVTGQLTGRG